MRRVELRVGRADDAPGEVVVSVHAGGQKIGARPMSPDGALAFAEAIAAQAMAAMDARVKRRADGRG